MKENGMALLLLATSSLYFNSAIASKVKHLRKPDTTNAGYVDCRLSVARGQFFRDDTEEAEDLLAYLCDIDGERYMRQILLPESFVRDSKRYIGDSPVLRISEATIERDSVTFPVGANITLQSKRLPNRRLATVPSRGTSSVVAARIVTEGGEQRSNTLNELRGQVFGVGRDAERQTVLTQYEQCSFGAKKLEAATVGTGVVDGVVQVQVNLPIAGCNMLGECQDIVREAIASTLDESLEAYGMVMVCVPTGSTFGNNPDRFWSAFAYTSNDLAIAFFSSGYCGVKTVHQHELGHLLGFGHSNEGRVRQDKSCSMGSSLLDIPGPRYCFNGHKYWVSRWMSDRRQQISLPDYLEGYSGRLVAFVDYEKDLKRKDRTLLRVRTGRENVEDIFVIYNRKKGFNDGVREKGDLVTVVQQIPGGDQQSEMLAGLGTGERMNLSGTSIFVEVCNLETELDTATSYAIVSIYDTSLLQTSTCGWFPLSPGNLTTGSCVLSNFPCSTDGDCCKEVCDGGTCQ